MIGFGRMKELFSKLKSERQQLGPGELEDSYEYHLSKCPGGLSMYVLVSTHDNSIKVTGILSGIKAYLEMEKIPAHKVYNYEDN